jgi:hypothetical protein
VAPAPGAGDRIGVDTDEAGGAFLFRVYVNGRLDAELRDPQRLIRTSKRYGGFILAGGAKVSVDRINLLRPGARSGPEPAIPDAPGEGHATGLAPELRWRPAVDPNLGQTIRDSVRLATSPSMAHADSIVDLEQTTLALTTALEPLTTYYWQVRAYDPTGRGSLSAVSSFVTASGSAAVSDAGTAVAAPQLRATPNPFNPATRLAFRQPTAGRILLTVYDVRGRLVRRLADEHRPAGEHVVWWDGRDEDGRACASGLYFARLETTAAVLSHKLVLAR